jgi:predicted Rossmann-fold nucleotide-binding protein
MVLIGKEYWQPLAELFARLAAEKTIDPDDAKYLVITDSPEEAVESIRDVAMHRFGLTYGPQLKPRWILGERWRHAAG